MVEVNTSDPGIISKRESANSGGEVDMDIFFKVSAKGVDGKEDTWKKTFSFSPLFNDVCSNKGNKVHKVTVEPEEVPEFGGHGKGDMLPGSLGKGVKAVFDPNISSLLAAGGAESGFAAMRYFNVF